jgi:hypothetical protein
MKTLVFSLALIFAVRHANGQAVPTHKPIIPVAPAELIKLLPAVPAGWELKQSRAKSFYNEWLVSQANREFSHPPLPPQSLSPGATPGPPQITRIRLTDTGYTPALFADFEAFKPGKYGNTESLYIDSLPARRMTLSDGERVRVLVKARFVLEVEVHGQLPNASIAWIKQLNFARLNSVPDSGVEKLPNPVTAVTIDELNPKLNGSYQVSWSTQEDLDAARKRKP